MINIVIYGKPRAFESHDFCFEDKDGSTFTDNSFPEPSLKPKHFDELVIHYFSNNGYAGVECYNRAKGYESDRDGIVFGIALKTDHDFAITKVIENILKPYWSDFASALLNDEDRFIRPTILEILNGTKWDKNDADNIKGSIEASSSHVPTKNMCLLYLPDLDQIPIIESQLKDFKDVYISANLDIFKDSINKVVLNQTQGQICTVENGTIVEIKNSNNTDTDVRKRKKWPWGTRQTSYSKDGNDDSSDSGNGKNKWKNKIAVFAMAFVAIVALLLMIMKPWQSSDENTPEVEEEKVAELERDFHVLFNDYDKPIESELNLDPRFEGNSGAVVKNDISYKVDKEEFVIIEQNGEKYMLKVKESPENEIKVTVKAYYDETDVGSKEYRIAAKRKTGTGTNVGNVPGRKPTNPDIGGKTIDDYLYCLETYDLPKPNKRNDVIGICERIIKSKDYDQTYIEKAKEIKEKAETGKAKSKL